MPPPPGTLKGGLYCRLLSQEMDEIWHENIKNIIKKSLFFLHIKSEYCNQFQQDCDISTKADKFVLKIKGGLCYLKLYFFFSESPFLICCITYQKRAAADRFIFMGISIWILILTTWSFLWNVLLWFQIFKMHHEFANIFIFQSLFYKNSFSSELLMSAENLIYNEFISLVLSSVWF